MVAPSSEVTLTLSKSATSPLASRKPIVPASEPVADGSVQVSTTVPLTLVWNVWPCTLMLRL